MRVFGQIFCLKILIPFMGLLRNLQAEIEGRSLPNGAWPSGKGETPVIETTCYALMALAADSAKSRSKATDVLLGAQNRDGSWPAFVGDNPEGCWTTALALIALRFVESSTTAAQKGIRWLVNNKGREGHWLWQWKFRTVDRSVQFNPDKYGWPWFPGTVSWVIPTALSIVALKQSLACCGTNEVNNRIELEGRCSAIDRALRADGMPAMELCSVRLSLLTSMQRRWHFSDWRTTQTTSPRRLWTGYVVAVSTARQRIALRVRTRSIHT
jgi:hypothetical protein